MINYTLRAYSKPFIRFKMQLIGKQATIPNHSTILTNMRKQRGFTLIELMVILAIFGIVVGFGVPQISRIIQNNRIVSSLNSLSAHLSYARSEAVKRSSNVSVVPQDNQNWLLGWQVFTDPNADGLLDAGEQQLRIVDNLNIPNNITIGTAGNFVTFNGQGVAAAETFTLIDPPNPDRTLTISVTGHVSIP